MTALQDHPNTDTIVPPPPQMAAPGWYVEPSTGQQRYWSGLAWGSYAAPMGAPNAPPQYYPASSAPGGEYQGGLVALGYIFAVLMPFVGFILGIVTVTRPSRATSKHGIWIILLSIVVFLIAVAVLSSNAANTTY